MQWSDLREATFVKDICISCEDPHVLAGDGDFDKPANKRGFCTATLGPVYVDTGVAVAGAEALQGLLSPGCYLLKMTHLTVRTCLSAEATSDTLLSYHFWEGWRGSCSLPQGRWTVGDLFITEVKGLTLALWARALTFPCHDAAKCVWGGSQQLLSSSQHCKYPFPRERQTISICSS